MQYTETQLTKLIEDVEKEFTAHLAKAEDETSVAKPESTESDITVLAKAEEGKKPFPKPEEKKDEKPEEKPEAEAKPESEAKPEAEAAPKEDAKPNMEAKPEGQAEAKPEGEAAPAPQGDEHCDYDEEDMSHMRKMYASMSKGELKAHHDCIAELAKCGDMSQGAPAMAKSEEIKTETIAEPIKIETAVETKPNEVELLKSELAAKDAKYDDLKKQFDGVAAFLTKLVEKKTAPAAKAITNLDVIAKSEGTGEDKVLSKGEIDSILTKKSAEPTLKKSDRELINAYYLTGASINSISHLLK